MSRAPAPVTQDDVDYYHLRPTDTGSRDVDSEGVDEMTGQTTADS